MDWESLPKPWSKEQCRLCYVQGHEDIGIRKLAVISGNSRPAIEGWVKSEQWVKQRADYRASLHRAINEKTIEKTSNEISDELSIICLENYKVHKLTRDYVAKIMELKARQLSEDLKITNSEDRRKAISLHNSYEINQWSQALTRSTDAINQIRGIKYFTEINTAVNKLLSAGYIILDPNNVDSSEI